MKPFYIWPNPLKIKKFEVLSLLFGSDSPSENKHPYLTIVTIVTQPGGRAPSVQML